MLFGDRLRKIKEYIYYRCTHYKQKCPDPYMEEQSLFSLFESAVSDISVNEDMFTKIKQYLLKVHQARSTQYNETKPVLIKRIREIETLRDKAYEDKLKGVIDEEYFNGRYNQWTKDIADFREELSTIESKNDKILHRCVLTFELANQARNLYKKQVPEQKARFLKMLLSNSFLKDGKLQFEFKKPFDMLDGMSKKPEMSFWLAR